MIAPIPQNVENGTPQPKAKSYTMFALSIITAVLAIPIIIFLGFLATIGIFASVPDVLLIPSLAGLAGGIGFGIWKLIQLAGKQISSPPAREVNAIQIQL